MNLKILEYDEVSQEIAKTLSAAIKTALEKREEIFQTALKTNAQPPITGEITKGKLKWRGIKIIECRESNQIWLEQRGKIISPKMYI